MYHWENLLNVTAAISVQHVDPLALIENKDRRKNSELPSCAILQCMTNMTFIKTCKTFVYSVELSESCPFFHYNLKYKHPILTLGFCVSAHPLALSK